MNKNKIIPELRFPEFLKENGWSIEELDKTLQNESSNISLNKLEFEPTGYPVYGADGLMGYIDSYKQDKDYIAIIKDGSGVGRLYYYHGKSSILSTLTYLKPVNLETCNLIFQYYLLSTIDFSIYIKGSGIPHIYYSDYKNETVATPTLPEQQKIADCLSSLDEVIAGHEEKRLALQDHKKGLMQNLFPQEGETKPKYRFPEFENEGEWEEKKLGEVAKFLKGESMSKADISHDGKLACIRYGELYTIYKEVINEVMSFTNLPQDTLVLSNANDVIIPASGETQIDIAKASCVKLNNIALGGDLNIIRSYINGVFLSYYLNHPLKYDIAKLAQGNAVVHLYNNQLKSIRLFIPKNPLEQKKIANCLSSLDNLITEQTERIEQLKQHKRGLMQGLFPKIEE